MADCLTYQDAALPGPVTYQTTALPGPITYCTSLGFLVRQRTVGVEGFKAHRLAIVLKYTGVLFSAGELARFSVHELRPILNYSQYRFQTHITKMDHTVRRVAFVVKATGSAFSAFRLVPDIKPTNFIKDV